MSNFEQFKDELKTVLVDARKPLVWLETLDWIFISDTLKEITKDKKSIDVNNRQSQVSVWDAAYGSRLLGTPNYLCNDQSIIEIIQNFISDKSKLLIVKVPKDTFLKQPNLVPLLQEVAYLNAQTGLDKKKTVMLILPIHTVVEDLEPLVERIDVPFPDREDIRNELGFTNIPQEYRDKKKNRKKKNPYSPDKKPYCFSGTFMDAFDKNSEIIVNALLGMRLFEIRSLMQSIQAEGCNQIQTFHAQYGNLKSRILAKRKQIVRNSGLLEVIDYEEHYYNRVGNVDGLMDYAAELKKYIDGKISKASMNKRPLPKGVLLVGEPGCGKSESAMAIASKLEIPLFRMNMGTLLGKFVGQSEHNFMEAIKKAEAAQPCVLWIDEIEKAFAGAGKGANDDDKVMTRIMGIFLTWMQEHKKIVFLVATANDLTRMKDEFLRKGRWDEIFYLPMPKGNGIKAIFQKSVEKYHLKLWDADEGKVIKDIGKNEVWQEMVSFMDGMSGADIDNLVSMTYQNVYGDDKLKEESVGSSTDNYPPIDKEPLLPIQIIAINAKSRSEEIKNAKEAELEQKVEKEILQMKIHDRTRELKEEEVLKKHLRDYFRPKDWSEKEADYKSKGYESAAATRKKR